MFKSFTTTLLLVIAGCGVFAQDNPEKPDKATRRQLKTEEKLDLRSRTTRYLILEQGAAYGQTLDRRMAMNRYTGAGAYLGIGLATWRPKGWTYHDILASRFLSIGQSHGLTRANNSFNESQGLYFRRLADRAGWQLYAGGGWSLVVNSRVHPELANSSLHAEGMLSAQAGIMAVREVRIPLLGDYRMEYLLRLPLGTAIGRIPSFGVSGLTDPSFAVAPLGSFTRVSSRLAISQPLRAGNPNRWQLAYSWDFYGYNDNEVHPLRVANHALTFSLFIRTGRLDWSKK